MQHETLQPEFLIGDRVFGHWGEIPFVGTVGGDNAFPHEQELMVSVVLDLPILHKGKITTAVLVKHSDISRLKKIDLE